MHRAPAVLVLLLLLLLSITPGAIAVRQLRSPEMGALEAGQARWGGGGEAWDPSVTNRVAARFGGMKRPPVRGAVTFEDAEATAATNFPGVQRHAAPRVVTATADAQSNIDNHKKGTVKTRARSANTRPWQPDNQAVSPSADWPNLASGAASMPALTVGSLTLSQTFEGATAVALSDSMAMPSYSSAKKGQAVADNLTTSKPTLEYRAASTRASWATTAQPIKSLAQSGQANHKFAIAQADQAVAMSHTQRSSDAALPANLRRQAQKMAAESGSSRHRRRRGQRRLAAAH